MNHLSDPTAPHFTLPNFQGPLDLLLYLISQEEIEVAAISIRTICDQILSLLETHLSHDISAASDLLPLTALLLWIKSKSLLPATAELQNADLELDPRWNTLKNMIDYQGFKQVARSMAELEVQQQQVYTRKLPEEGLSPPHHSYLVPVPVVSLAQALQKLLHSPPSPRRRTIIEEAWLVADAITYLRQRLTTQESIAFEELFLPEMCKAQWIITFLGILEMMKMGEMAALFHEDHRVTLHKSDRKERERASAGDNPTPTETSHEESLDEVLSF
jgi:segregation and condensation protein A